MEINNNKEIKPFLRWAGSKRKIVSTLREYWCPTHGTYIEPFAGSASLYFDILPKRAVLSDANPDLINLYKAIKSDPEKVWAFASSLPKDKVSYYKIRASLSCDDDIFSRSSKFLYLNRFCFNGLYRTNNKGEFNVPYGAGRSGSIPSLAHLKAVSKKLVGTKILNKDFEVVLDKTAKTGDFVYLDPPYSIKNKRVFAEYGPSVFNDADIERLKVVLSMLDKRKVSFLMSYSYCLDMIDQFDHWNIRFVNTKRSIASSIDSRTTVVEALISNIDINGK